MELRFPRNFANEERKMSTFSSMDMMSWSSLNTYENSTRPERSPQKIETNMDKDLENIGDGILQNNLCKVKGHIKTFYTIMDSRISSCINNNFLYRRV